MLCSPNLALQKKLEKEDEEALRIEVDILGSVSHPNIVKMRQVCDLTSFLFVSSLTLSSFFF